SITALVVSLIVPFLGQVALISIPLWRQLLMRISPARQSQNATET
ncbi:MAG: hypothetical protein GY844_30175, partial [Bradyrhizobium sp.]|nr:hypothetical protein [Bradyrhizobium sp.]